MAPWLMDSPLNPFFWVVKRMLINVTAMQMAGLTVVAGVGWLQKNCMSWRLNGVETVSVPPA